MHENNGYLTEILSEWGMKIPYHPYYCEENAYQICRVFIDGVDIDPGWTTRALTLHPNLDTVIPRRTRPEQRFEENEESRRDGALLFIFGSGEWVALHHQRAADEDRPLYWDYHVIACLGVVEAGEPSGEETVRWLALDPESRLPFGYPLPSYLSATFPPGTPGAPRFRWVPWEEGRKAFGSDRRHMRDGNGGWLQPPPPWSPINADRHTLPRFLARSANDAGRLYTYKELISSV